MLIGAIDALSGGLLMYFLMSELTGGTSNYKDKEPLLKKSGIYKINCKQCDKV